MNTTISLANLAPYLLTAAVALLGWMARKWVQDLFAGRDAAVDEKLHNLDKGLAEIRTSLEKPNGGSSVRDALNRIESAQITMLGELAHLKGRFDNHIEEGK